MQPILSKFVLLPLLKEDPVKALLYLIAQYQLGKPRRRMRQIEKPLEVAFGLVRQWCGAS
ncbi:hypothetical protein BC350_02035 [Ralstonia pseudosolanacearum]|uniref:Uncharacterized protein n=1 Tax=Ralstonia solanacearum TaxID=305 RepID=A0A0S4X4W4_RALSL|nr:hypothetical protein BC350_02035 [Ralstonia pseudosolanacearum]CUV58458.1 protein of unknown function [Ralstonia solanacearum]